MPNKKESAAEKAARFQKASSALSLRADLQTCYQVMKSNAAAVRAVHKCLTSLGYLSADGSVAENAPSTTASETSTPTSATPKSAGKRQLHDLFDMSAAPPESPRQASVEALQFILSKLEPASLSQHALRGCLRGAQRKLPKSLVMELLVFTVDADEDSGWPQTGTWSSLLDQLAEINEANGRRARDIVMPVTWSTGGIYNLDLSGGALWLENKFTGARAAVRDPPLLRHRLGQPGRCHQELLAAHGYDQPPRPHGELALLRGLAALLLRRRCAGRQRPRAVGLDERPVGARGAAGRTGPQHRRRGALAAAGGGRPPSRRYVPDPPIKRRRSFESQHEGQSVNEGAPGARGSSSAAPSAPAEPAAPVPAQADDEEADFCVS